MSQENVEIVRRVVDRFDIHDFPWELLDPDVEWVIDPPAWVAGTYRGHDGVRTMLRGMAEAFDMVRYEVDRYLASSDAVVTLGRLEVRGERSGVTTGQPLAQLIRIRDGRIVSIRGNLPPEEALALAGLLEDDRARQDPGRTPPEGELRWQDVMRRRLG